jgi:hypothetical protein
MANKKQSIQRKTVGDSVALAAAIIYFQSVLTVAHHTSNWEHSGTTHTVEGPAYVLLAVSLVYCIYSWYHAKRTFSPLIIITLTILATSTLFWWLGLRVNFFF